MRSFFALMLFFSSLFATPLQAEQGNSKPRLLASVEPIAMLLREVLGDTVTVDTFLLPSQTPHDASFTPGQARKVQRADLIVWLGAEAEPSLARLMTRARGAELALLSLPNVHRRTLLGTEGEQEQSRDEHHDHSADHDHDHQHAAGALDPHLWLAPDNMLLLAQALPATLQPLGVAAESSQQAVDVFAERLKQQRQAISAQLKPFAQRPYISHHDAWGYFAETFTLRAVTPISANTTLSPGSRRFLELLKKIKQQDIRCVMAEPESRRALLERLCQGDCRIVEADPLGRSLGEVGYNALLQDLADRFVTCL